MIGTRVRVLDRSVVGNRAALGSWLPDGWLLVGTHLPVGRQMIGPGKPPGADDAGQRNAADGQEQPPPPNLINSSRITIRTREIPHPRPGWSVPYCGKYGCRNRV